MILEQADIDLVQSLVGCRIVAARWFDLHPDNDWDEHEACQLTLDDGRIIEFGSSGYDSSGATVRLVEAEV